MYKRTNYKPVEIANNNSTETICYPCKIVKSDNSKR